MDFKEEINSNRVTVGDSNNPLSPMDRSSQQKNKQGNSDLKWHTRTNEFNWYGTFYLKAAEYTFFSCVHGSFSKIDQIIGHKISLNKFKKIKISSTFSDLNGMKLEINFN